MQAPRCAAATVDCMPIDQQMDVYANNVIQIISTPPQGLSYSMPSFVQVRTMQSNTASFQNTLNAAQDMLVQSAVPIITNARAAIDTIFGQCRSEDYVDVRVVMVTSCQQLAPSLPTAGAHSDIVFSTCTILHSQAYPSS